MSGIETISQQRRRWLLIATVSGLFAVGLGLAVLVRTYDIDSVQRAWVIGRGFFEDYRITIEFGEDRFGAATS